MAKSDFGSKQELQEYLKSLKEIDAQYKNLNKQAKDLANVPGKARVEIQKQLKELEKQNDSHKEILASIKRAQKELDAFKDTQQKISKEAKKTADALEDVTDELKQQNKELSEQQKRIKALGEEWDEIDDLQTSISNGYHDQYGDVSAIQKKIDGTKALMGGISTILQQQGDSYNKNTDKILEAAEAWKDQSAMAADFRRQLKKGNITEEEHVKALKEQLDDYDEMISKIKITDKETAKLVETMKQMSDEQRAYVNIQSNKVETKKGIGALGDAVMGNAPAPIGNLYQAGKQLNSAFSKGEIMTAALVAGVYGFQKALAYSKSLEEIQFNGGTKNISPDNIILKQRMYEANDQLIAMDASVKEIGVQLGKTTESGTNFVKTFAEFDFDTKMKGLVLQFDKASKTAFFGQGLGSVSYAKDQLELAGISAERIVQASKALSSEANSGMQSIADDAAVFATRAQIGDEELANMLKAFRRMDGVSSETALNIAQFAQSIAFANGINPGDFMGEVANASKAAMDYNIGSGKALIEQVKNVKLIGGSFDKIAEAGKSMVLNYKDGIKAEMTLGSILGENVDLSEVRALFAANRIDEAAAAFKATGLAQKAQAKGQFAVQALKGAAPEGLYDMAINPDYEKGKTTTITQNATAANEQFLSAFKNANLTFEIGSAVLNITREAERKTMKGGEGDLIDEYFRNGPLLDNYVKGIQNQIDKFMDVEASSIKKSFNPFSSLSDIGKTRTLRGPDDIKLFSESNIDRNSSIYYPKPESKNTSVPKPESKNTSVPSVNIKKIADTSIKSDEKLGSIDSSEKRNNTLTENIQTLTTMMLKFFNPTSTSGILTNNIKLYLDGKEVTKSVIRNTIDSTGMNKNAKIATSK
jgi:predicted  nucleic acid-binding Zn-ribbon protein